MRRRSYCSEFCFDHQNNPAVPRPLDDSPFEFQLSTKESFVRVQGRRGAVGLVGAGCLYGVMTAFYGREWRPTPPGELPHRVEYQDWTLPTVATAWSGPLEIVDGALAIAGPLFYAALEEARQGIVEYNVSLGPNGAGHFLVGCTTDARNGYAVRVQSRPMQWLLSGFRIVDGVRKPLSKPLIIDRLERTNFELRIEFEADSILARMHEHQRRWDGLILKPGRIGLEGSRADDLRLYHATIALKG